MKKRSKLQLIYISLLLATSFSSFSQVGIGTVTPDASAALDITSTTGGFLPPRMTSTQIRDISKPVEGLMVYCTTCPQKGVFVYDGKNFINIFNGNNMNVFDTTTKVVDVTSTTGKTWMDRNLGAAQVATSSNDAASYGDLYQWGRVKDGHESRTSGTTATTATSANAGHDKFIIADDNWTSFADELWQSGLNDPCPVGYRIPTKAELEAELETFNPKNAAGAYDSDLKLPAAGHRTDYQNGMISSEGEFGFYWSSTVMEGSEYSTNTLWVNKTIANISHFFPAYGFSVRCIKKEDVASIVAAAKNNSDYTISRPSLDDLREVGLINVIAYQAAYKEAIAEANPAPTTLEELQAIIDAVNVAAIVAAADNPAAGGTPTLDDLRKVGLTEVGLTNVTAYQAAYEEAIAEANPAPKTLAELQFIIDLVNIVAAAHNPADGTPSLAELTTVGLKNLKQYLVAGYEEAIAEANPTPKTLAQLQAIIDAVNVQIPKIEKIVNDANYPANGTPSIDDLTQVGLKYVKEGQAYQKAYEGAIAIAKESSVPRILSELQAIIDAVNIRDITTKVVDVESATGKIWMDRNLGATQAATSSNDEKSYGDLYQWGRGKDGHEKRDSETIKNYIAQSADAGHGKFITGYPNWTTFTGELWQSDLNDPCPVGYRIPTKAELDEERKAFSSNNADGAFTSVLKLPAAGRRTYYGNGNLSSIGEVGYYWSISTTLNNLSYFLNFNDNSGTGETNEIRANGHSVRCIKMDVAVTKDEEAIASIVAAANNPAADGTPSLAELTTVGLKNLKQYRVAGYEEAIAEANPAPTTLAELQAIIDAVNKGIDIITEVVDVQSTTGKTWMDRNLGATRVAESSNDEKSYGDLYQWGRRKDGHEKRDSETINDIAHSADADHGKFIIADDNWTDFTGELWQSGINDPCPVGYRIPTKAELDDEKEALNNKGVKAHDSFLKLPAAGNRTYYQDGMISLEGEFGFYWSSTVIEDKTRANRLGFFNSTNYTSEERLTKGFSVRCIKKEDVASIVDGAKNSDYTISRPSLDDLREVGLINVKETPEEYKTVYQAAYKEEIAEANPEPTTLEELQDIIDDVNAEIVAVAAIVAAANNPAAGGTPSLDDLREVGLTEVGLTNVTAYQAAYEEAIAKASPVPTRLEELQAIIDDVNAEIVAVAAIVAAANNPAAGGTPTLDDLRKVGLTEVGLTNVTAYQAGYEEAIAEANPAPTTLEELQAIINAVNVQILKIEAIVAAANYPANGTPTIDDLIQVEGLENVIEAVEGYQKVYEEAIAIAKESSVPRILSELQAIIDAVNIRDITTKVVDVQSTTGKTWMDRNLGATQVATSSKDEESYGDLYQWGRAKDGHESRDSGVIVTKATSANAGHDKFIIADDNWTTFAGELWQSDLNDPCPVGYRIPTKAELDEERKAFSSNNADGAFNSVLKLPLAGYRTHNQDGKIFLKGEVGYYWSISTTLNNLSYFLEFNDNSSNGKISSNIRSLAFSVRCIKTDDAVTKDKEAIASIVAAANNPAADGTPSLEDLRKVGLTNVRAYQAAYKEAIAEANPAPKILAELQVIIDLVNIVAAANNPAAGGTPSLIELTTVGLTYVKATPEEYKTAYQKAYEEAIAEADLAPKTLAELQAIIDAVNEKIVAVEAIVNAAKDPADDGTPSLIELTTVGLTYVKAAYQAVYKEAIAVAYLAPKTLAQLQAIIDAVNEGKDITTKVVDVESATTGKIWMDRNLGATQAATSSNDEKSYGDLYQWGRRKDGHEKRDSETINDIAQSADADHGNFIIADDNWTDFTGELWQSGLNDPCPVGYRIPTKAELEAELATFNPKKNAAGAFNSFLKLPVAGVRLFNGELYRVDDDKAGYYWSSTVVDSEVKFLAFSNGDAANMHSGNPVLGLSVRCIKRE